MQEYRAYLIGPDGHIVEHALSWCAPTTRPPRNRRRPWQTGTTSSFGRRPAGLRSSGRTEARRWPQLGGTNAASKERDSQTSQPPAIYGAMRKSPFEPCIPTPRPKVPDRPEWIHEIKHDGYRLIVQRDGKRVRLFTRNGHDWSGRFPLITEAALRNRNSSFVIDGEAVLLGVDGMSRFQRPAFPQAR